MHSLAEDHRQVFEHPEEDFSGDSAMQNLHRFLTAQLSPDEEDSFQEKLCKLIIDLRDEYNRDGKNQLKNWLIMPIKRFILLKSVEEIG